MSFWCCSSPSLGWKFTSTDRRSCESRDAARNTVAIDREFAAEIVLLQHQAGARYQYPDMRVGRRGRQFASIASSSDRFADRLDRGARGGRQGTGGTGGRADNPHVRILISSPGLVLEEHDLGGEFAVNRYSILAASRLSHDRLSVEVNSSPAMATSKTRSSSC